MSRHGFGENSIQDVGIIMPKILEESDLGDFEVVESMT